MIMSASQGQRARALLTDASYWPRGYYPLGQLRGARESWPDPTPAAGEQPTYALDDIGNRSSRAETKMTESIAGQNHSFHPDMILSCPDSVHLRLHKTSSRGEAISRNTDRLKIWVTPDVSCKKVKCALPALPGWAFSVAASLRKLAFIRVHSWFPFGKARSRVRRKSLASWLTSP